MTGSSSKKKDGEILIPVTIRLPQEIVEWLEEARYSMRMPKQDVVRVALEELRKKEDEGDAK